MESKTLLLAQIRIDGGTQFRDISTEVVDSYAEAMKAGSKLPPVDVAFDGKHYWMVDGFQRYLAANKIGEKKIQAVITKGTQRDAKVKACGVNETHGLRRDKKAKLAVIEFIEDDEELSKLKDDEKIKIANLSIAHYRRLRSELYDEIEDKESPKTTQRVVSGQMESINPEKKQGSSSKNEDNSPETDNPNKESAKTKMEDAVGNTLPKDLIEPFSRGKIQANLNILNQMHREITELINKGDVEYIEFNMDAFEAGLRNVKDALSASKPYAICGYCGGRVGNMECRCCHGRGWVNKSVYIATPQEFKKVKK